MKGCKNDSLFNIKVCLATNIALQFTRLVFSLQVSKTFGPMVKILGSMLLDVTVFMLLFAALFLIFNAIGQLIFQELPQFNSPIQTAITLFSWCLGNFDYNIFNNWTEVSPYVGYIFLTVFQLFTMIMLLNFLIAILSNTYANLNDVQIGLYLRKVLFLRQRGGYDSHYSAIIYAVPPLNIIAFVLLPFITYWRSRRFNRMLLFIMYVPVGTTAFWLFTLSHLVMLPVTYIILLLNKAWNVPIKPIFGAKDFFLRVLDLTFFIFCGPFLLLFWVSLDFINYWFKLLDYKIVYINSHEEDAQEKINQHMDGSIRFKETERRKQAGEPPLEDEDMPKSRSLNRVLNPVKEGLADNTLKILKACLKTVKDRHFKSVGLMDKDLFKYVPTVWILFEIKEILMIQEQINAILFGVGYQKRDSFINSQNFEDIVDALLEFEKKTIRIDAEDWESDSEEAEGDGEIGENEQSNKSLDRRDEIARDMRLFITKSNEKWILDQFNLCKKFLIQNSIQGHYDEFSHPVYENFSHIKGMKEKWWDLKSVGKNYKTFTNMVKSTQSGVTEAVSLKNINGELSEK